MQAERNPRSGLQRPPLGLFLTEPWRSALDLAALLVAAPWLAHSPRGDGHPVLVLPGLLATDASTIPLRRFLSHLGYRVHGWRLGRNVGPTSSIVAGMPAALERLTERYSRPVSVIGWSLGGIYARRLARQSPDSIRQVITLGSPFAMTDSSQSRAVPAFDRYVHRHMPGHTGTAGSRATRSPMPMPASAIYSRSDGIVAWQTCREAPGPRAESIAVRGSHLGLGHNPAVLWAVADRLALDVDHWKPFATPRALRALYPADESES